MRSRADEQNEERSIRARTLATAPLLIGVLLALLGAPDVGAVQTARIHVIEVSGLIDPVLVDFIEDALVRAEREDAAVVVMRLDSRGDVLSKREADSLIAALRASPVPVAVWVGPGRGARANGAAADIVAAAAITGGVPGTTSSRGEPDVRAATLGDFIVELDGREVRGGRLSVPSEVVRRPGRPPQRQLDPAAEVRFDEPPFISQVLHAVATPGVAYGLLLVGLLLVVFEFFTGGIGVAAAVAVAFIGFAAYGLGVLPTRPVGLGLVGLGIIGYAIDVQAGAPRTWSAIGTVALVAGSASLFDGFRVPLPVLVIAVPLVALFMVAGMPSVVRMRYSTPTIGRESMLGEFGRAIDDVDPEGTVEVRRAPWRARTNRATPIRAGDRVRVVAIDGLLLEVEPEQGGARDAGH